MPIFSAAFLVPSRTKAPTSSTVKYRARPILYFLFGLGSFFGKPFTLTTPPMAVMLLLLSTLYWA